MKPNATLVTTSTLLLIGGGCKAPARMSSDAAQREMLALLMPSRVEIVEPFTRVQSFGGDPAPDGIELLIQAINSLDSPGLMIAGALRVALYEYVPASGDAKGRRLELWKIELATPKQQRAHWNAMTQMYEFRLGLEPSNVPPAEKYVLALTYTSPLGERLEDECLIQFRSSADRAPEASTRPRNP